MIKKLDIKRTIKTDDTGEIIDLDNPAKQAWVVSLSISCLASNVGAGYGSSTEAEFVFTRQTLVDAGLLPECHGDAPPPPTELSKAERIKLLCEELFNELKQREQD
jgi:hypothetical protein